MEFHSETHANSLLVFAISACMQAVTHRRALRALAASQLLGHPLGEQSYLFKREAIFRI